MAGKSVGTLIKEARAAAGLTQAQLAEKAGNVTAAEISRAERGEKELSQAVLKAIAKATGITQSSLLAAAAGKTSGNNRFCRRCVQCRCRHHRSRIGCDEAAELLSSLLSSSLLTNVVENLGKK